MIEIYLFREKTHTGTMLLPANDNRAQFSDHVRGSFDNRESEEDKTVRPFRKYRGTEVGRFSTRENTGPVGLTRGSNIVPNANRGLHRVSAGTTHHHPAGLSSSLMQPGGRQPARPDARYRVLLRAAGNRRNACVADPIPLSRISLSPLDISTRRDAYESRPRECW